MRYIRPIPPRNSLETNFDVNLPTHVFPIHVISDQNVV